VTAAFRVGLLVAFLVGGFLLVRLTPLGAELEAAAHTIAARAEAPWAPPAFALLYAGAIALGAPGTLLTVIGGVAFGFARGLAVNFAGALLGATAAFFIGRFVARDAVLRLFGKHLARLPDLASGRAAFFAFLRLRLIPLVPFNGLNFAAGVTRAKLLPYLAGTALGIVPSTVAYTWFAAELAPGGSGADRARAMGSLALVLALACAAAILPSVVGSRPWSRPSSSAPPGGSTGSRTGSAPPSSTSTAASSARTTGRDPEAAADAPGFSSAADSSRRPG
jgi:uncharacterized membrane protein YdjX (TVP38/TMEM64 family)